MQDWQKKIAQILGLILIIFAHPIYATIPVYYSAMMGEENWQMKGNLLRCGLAYPLPDYGIAYFEQFATKRPHFIIRKWQENRKVTRATVTVSPPVWKPSLKTYPIAATAVNPGKFSMYLNEHSALKLLTFLYQGYQVTIRYRSNQNFDMHLTLSPIKFRKMYARYTRCVGQLLDFNYKDVAETVFHFGIDSQELDDEMKNRLRLIAQYVRADQRIEKVRVIGYTDDTGRNGYNNAISQNRATIVSNYLMMLGLTKDRLSVTWLGELKPIARNDTDDGRAQNRRVEIKLIKK